MRRTKFYRHLHGGGSGRGSGRRRQHLGRGGENVSTNALRVLDLTIAALAVIFVTLLIILLSSAGVLA